VSPLDHRIAALSRAVEKAPPEQRPRLWREIDALVARRAAEVARR
jgi:hypothetical protein